MSADIVFTGGGSGGHVFPGLAVAEILKQRGNTRISWIGSRKGMEKAILLSRGISFHGIPAGKLRRYVSFRNVLDLFNILAGILASLCILSRLKPRVVFSKGGYVTVPPVIAAAMLRIPVVTHESDVDPGLATKINARFAQRICVSWEESKACFDDQARRKVVVTGNPVRQELYAGNRDRGREFVGADDDDPVVVVLGGSQGARQVNELIHSIWKDLVKRCWLVHQTGRLHTVESDNPRYITYDFIHDELPHIIAAADVVVSRAGANTLWETAALGKASVLIPLSGSGTRGDQVRNARLLEEAGAARVLEGEGATSEALLETILLLLDSEEERNRMAKTISGLHDKEAAGVLADLLGTFTGA